MHMFAGLGTIVLCAAVVVPPTLLGGSASAGPDIDLSQMESIEAELAMKSETAPRQPQKEKRARPWNVCPRRRGRRVPRT